MATGMEGWTLARQRRQHLSHPGHQQRSERSTPGHACRRPRGVCKKHQWHLLSGTAAVPSPGHRPAKSRTPPRRARTRPTAWSSLQPDPVGKPSELSLQLPIGFRSELAVAGEFEAAPPLLTQTEHSMKLSGSCCPILLNVTYLPCRY